MKKNDKKIESDSWLKDLPVQSEIVAFQSDEMITCAKCGRKSPPTRTGCFYCGEIFPSENIQTDFVKPNLRKPETWENGFNLIYQPGKQEFGVSDMREISKFLDVKTEFLKNLFKRGESLPVARLASKTDSEILSERLAKTGFNTLIVADENLDLKIQPRRLRKIGFEAEKIILTLFNRAERVEISPENLCLIVTGSIFEKKTETIEKRVKSKENKTLNIDETAKDEKIIDIYEKGDLTGYRILISGFDFSGLGKDMSFLGFENIKKICSRLKEFAPEAKAFEDYDRIRNLLGEVWEIEEKRDSHELAKKGIGNFNLKKSAILTNLQQFTRYSRLQRHLL